MPQECGIFRTNRPTQPLRWGFERVRISAEREKTMSLTKTPLLFTIFAILAATSVFADVATQIQTIKQVGPAGSNHAAAVRSALKLAAADYDTLFQILESIDEETPLANNWLRSAISSIVDRHQAKKTAPPITRLAEYVRDTSHSSESRFIAFQLLRSLDEGKATTMVPGLKNDESLDLRRLAVADLIQQAAANDDSVELYQQALEFARDVDQIEDIAEQLETKGVTANLVEHFGFLTSWRVVGPFDHTGSKCFNVAYPPEQEIDLSASYPGQSGNITWKEITTDDKLGVVDLNEDLGKHKGAIAYAYTEFEAESAMPIELRLGCINANKIWLNGKLLTQNEVYHSGTVIDQYVGKGELKAGKNRILLKIAQNEQTESWAQRWQFQLRVCNKLGTAVLPAD